MMERTCICLRVILTFSVVQVTFAQVPLQFTYQGRLTDDSGVPVTGAVTGTFHIIKGGDELGGGHPVFSETHTNMHLDANGTFSVVIGSISNIPITAIADGSISNRYLEAVINNETNRPRQQLVAVPYSITSLKNLEQTITARYTTGSTPQTISHNVLTVVNFETKSIDTHNAVTIGDDWTFTAPLPGIYIIQASVRFSNSTAWDPADRMFFQYILNNSQWSVVGFKEAHVATGISSSQVVQGSDVVRMNEGDEFKIKIFQHTGLPLAILNAPDNNIVSIVRIGL